MKLHTIAFILLVVGGLNWLLVGLVRGWDLANYVGGSVAMIVYILVGLAALYELFSHKSRCRNCSTQQAAM